MSNPEILQKFRGKCVRCRRSTNTVHEIIPKSQNLSWSEYGNQVPLCVKCHEYVHKDGWSNHFLEIVNLRDQRLVEYEVVPDVQQIVNDLDSQMSDNYSKIIILTEKNWVKVKELLLFQQRRIKDLEIELDHGT